MQNLMPPTMTGNIMKQTYHHIGIIGLGARGQQLAALIYSLMPEYGEVTAAADWRENLVLPSDLTLNCPNLKIYKDSHELLINSAIDTVIITTYPETHMQIAMEAIEAGKAVLCDKPVTGSLDESVRLYDFVTSRPCRFAIGLNLPFYPCARKIKELLDAETIGKLLCVRGMCDVGANFGHSVILRKFAGQKEGLVLGKLTHDTDLMQYLAGSYAEEVYGKTANFLWKRHGDDAGSDDTAIISGILHNGVMFSQSLTSCGATYGRVMQFWGSKGMISADINSEDISIELTDGEKRPIHLKPEPGSHRGGDKVMFSEFLDYVNSGAQKPLRPERILSSIMVPLAAMKQTLVQTGEWYRSHLKNNGI